MAARHGLQAGGGGLGARGVRDSPVQGETAQLGLCPQREGPRWRSWQSSLTGLLDVVLQEEKRACAGEGCGCSGPSAP